ncbi:MAG: hypothetical protein K2N05_08955 [Muribaculaceae bacterium]|nr:hypothetical protein [Muribaculaceae bacterium]
MGMFELGSRDEVKKYSDTPANRKLRHWAYVFAAGMIGGLLLSIILLNVLSHVLILIIRGCVGLFAIVFVVLVVVIAYRVNKARINGWSKRDDSNIK